MEKRAAEANVGFSQFLRQLLGVSNVKAPRSGRDAVAYDVTGLAEGPTTVMKDRAYEGASVDRVLYDQEPRKLQGRTEEEWIASMKAHGASQEKAEQRAKEMFDG